MSDPDRRKLQQLIKRMKGKTLHLWADLVVDHYIYGVPKRISREAPVLILSKDREWMVPGGGANTLKNIVSLQGVAFPAGVVGDDPAGSFLIDTCRDLGMDYSGIRIDPDSRTLTKVRILAGPRSGAKQQIVRIDQEWSFSRSDTTLPNISSGEILVVSDYGYGTVVPERVQEYVRSGVRVIVDSRYRLGRFPGVFAVTPNEEEASDYLGKEFYTNEDAVWAAGKIRSRLEVEAVLLTLGSRGMVLSSQEETTLIPVVGSDQPVDVTGAGDTVLAAFSLAIASGASVAEASHIANHAGAVVVMKLGTAVCEWAELMEGIRSLAG